MMSMFKAAKKSAFAYFIMAATFVLTFFAKIDVVFILIGFAVFGIIWSTIRRKEQMHDTP